MPTPGPRTTPRYGAQFKALGRRMRPSFRIGCIAFVATCSACSADHSATFTDPAGGASITVVLRSTNPVLAEYDRDVVLAGNGKVVAAFKLMPDTGGYAAANLYRCSSTTYALDSYSEYVVIDTAAATIRHGQCQTGRTYLGIFSGGGSEPWVFSSASQIDEKKLVMRGG